MSRSKREVAAVVSGMGVFVAIISNLVELVKKFGGTMEQIYRLATPEGTETLEAVARVIASGANKARNEFLRLISGGHSLVLDAVDGTETLLDAKEVFSYRDSAFKNWGANERGMATVEAPVEAYEMTKDATFSQMFGSLSSDVRRLCLTQHQIKKFVKKYRDWLRTEGYATFFLFESHGHFFVAHVHVSSTDRLLVYVLRFESDNAWLAGLRLRVVVPQLA